MNYLLSSLLSGFLLCIAAFASPVPSKDLQTAAALTTFGANRHTIMKRQDDWSDTRSELSECKPVTVIFARGTIELGNVGSITGPPFFNALGDLIGDDKVAVQGVDYPANIQGYLTGGDKGGAGTTAKLLEQAASECPNTQIVLSGYSQGAQVVHLGEAEVTPEIATRIAAVVSLMDPLQRKTDVKS